MFSNIKYSIRLINRNRVLYSSESRQAQLYGKRYTKSELHKNQKLAQLKKPLKQSLNAAEKKQEEAELSKIITENVMKVINKGNNSTQLENMGIEVTKVKNSTSLDKIVVFWTPKNKELKSEVLAKLFKKTAEEIKSTLHELEILTTSCKVSFVNLSDPKTDLEIKKLLKDTSTNLSNETENKIQPSNLFLSSIHVPKMRHDVFGLHYNQLRDSIIKNIEEETNLNNKKSTKCDKAST